MHKIEASELFIKTPRSVIQNGLQISFDSLETIAQNPEKALVNINLIKTLIDFDEVFALLPELKKNSSLAKMKHQKVNIESKVNGSLKALNISQLNVATLQGTKLNASGKLFNVTDPKTMSFDVRILPSQTVKNDLSKFVKFNQNSFENLPTVFNFHGTAKGNLDDFSSYIHLHGEKLLVDAQVKLLHVNQAQNLKYDANMNAINIQKDLILAFIPQDKVPQNIELPSTIILTGMAMAT